MSIPFVFGNQTGPIPLSQLDDNFTYVTSNFVNIDSTFTGEPQTNAVTLQKISTFSGGTPGWVNSILYAVDTVSGSPDNYEWTITSVLNNSATGNSQNVAINGTARMLVANCSPTWASNFAVSDFTNTSAAGKGNLIGCEIDCNFNDVDVSTGSRAGLTVFSGDGNYTNLNVNGIPGTAKWGILVDAQTFGAGCYFINGVAVKNTSSTGNSFYTSATNGTAYFSSGTHVWGLDLGTATCYSGAIRIPSGGVIALDVNGVNVIGYDGSGFRYSVSGANYFRVLSNGSGIFGNFSANIGFALQSNISTLSGTTQAGYVTYDSLSAATLGLGISVSQTIKTGTTMANYYGVQIVSPTLTGTAAVSNECIGLNVLPLTAGSTYNIGILLQVASSATGGYNIYASGTAPNYFKGIIQVPGAAQAILQALTTVTSGAGANTGTLTNSPVTGNPTKWIPFNDAGTTRYIPAW